MEQHIMQQTTKLHIPAYSYGTTTPSNRDLGRYDPCRR